MSFVGIVSETDISSNISDSHDTDDFEFFAFSFILTKLLYVHFPPFFDIDFAFTTLDVFGALWITLNPLSRFCPPPANDIPVNSVFAPSPFNMLIGYSIDIFEPNEPDTQSIFAFFPTIAFFVFKLSIFFDQFSIVEYLK